MNENASSPLERRSRQLFDASVDNVDMRLRSRLNKARQKALEAGAIPRMRLFGLPLATSAAGVCAAALLGVAVWVGVPSGLHPLVASEGQANFEDLDIVASTEESSGETLEMLQEDAEFYDWAAEKSVHSDGSGVG